MGALLSDLRHAARALLRQPRYLVTSVLTLAIGIGATTAIFTIFKAVVLEPLPFEEPGQLVKLNCASADGYFSRPDFLDFRDQARSFSSLASYYDYSPQGFDLTGGPHPLRVVAMPVSADYFRTLGYVPVLGSGFTRAEENPRSKKVVISDQLWREHFRADPDIVGRAIMLDRQPWTVIGVLPVSFREPFDRKIDVFRAEDLVRGDSARWNYYLSVLGRLRPGVSLDTAQAELEAIATGIDAIETDRRPWLGKATPLRDAVIGGSKSMLFILFGAVALVLLIATTNVANLTLARNTTRERELAIRSALGGGRIRLVRQLLSESLVTAALGGAAGLAFAWWLLGGLVALRPEALPRVDAIAVDLRVFLFATAVSMMSGVLFGLGPARRFAHPAVESVLRQGGRSTTAGSRHRRARSLLVVAEIALAFVLLVAAALLVQSLANLVEVDPGFDGEAVVTFDLSLPASSYPVEEPTRRIQLHTQLHERLAALPGVRASGAVSRLPMTGTYHSWGYAIRGESEAAGREVNHLANMRLVSGDYFAALGIDLLEGRFFTDQDTLESPRAVIVNRSMVERRFANTDPIGERIHCAGEWQIVGVVEDVRIGLRDESPDRLYFPYAQFANDRAWTMTHVVAGTGAEVPQMAPIQRQLAALDPELVPFNTRRLESLVATAVAREEFTMTLLVVFAGVALALALVGIFGVVSYSVGERRHEIGVRIALGACSWQIRSDVLREGMLLAGIAVVLGWGGATVLTRLLASLVYEVSPSDGLTFGAVAVVLLTATYVTCMIPALKAARAGASMLLRSG